MHQFIMGGGRVGASEGEGKRGYGDTKSGDEERFTKGRVE